MHKKFFELIQIAIGNKTGFDKAPTDIEWAKLFDLACMQSLVSVALEGINKLKTANPNLNIDINLLLEWIGIQQQTIAENKNQNQRINLNQNLNKRNNQTKMTF